MPLRISKWHRRMAPFSLRWGFDCARCLLHFLWVFKNYFINFCKFYKFYFAAVVLSVIIMGFTIAVYGYHQELRDTHGKCLISLMSSLILIYLFLPNTEFTKFITTANSWTLFMIMMMFTGLLLTFLCFSTIVYHLMFKLKYVVTQSFSYNKKFLFQGTLKRTSQPGTLSCHILFSSLSWFYYRLQFCSLTCFLIKFHLELEY